jgi:hypothetical protein
MSSSHYNYHPFHTIGAATLMIWDALAGGSGAWRRLSKVADCSLIVSTEQAGKDITVKGLTQPVARRNRSKRYSISFRLLENAGPEAHDLIFSEGTTQLNSGENLIVAAEVLRLYGSDYTELSHPYGIVQLPLAPPGAPDASAGSTGGSIPPNTYYYWVEPVLEYGGSPVFSGEAGGTGPVTVSSGQTVTITFTPPADYTPDGYRVFFNTTDDLATAQIALGNTESSPTVLTSHQGGGSFDEQDEPLIEIYSYDGSVQYEHGVDFAVHAGKGLVKRLPGGAIAEGQRVLAIYAYERQPSVLTTLGCPVQLERYRRIKLLQLSPEADDGGNTVNTDNWRETGVEFEFFKVNVSLNDSSFPFSEDEFSEGSSLSWDCLFDGSEGKVGTLRSTYGVLADYE